MCTMKPVWFLIILAVSITGCSSKEFRVSGTIQYSDGTPVSKGLITFVSADRNVMVETDDNGRYTTANSTNKSGLTPGQYKVTISAKGLPDGAKGERPVEMIDAKFSNVTTSELSLDVTSSMTKDFVVERAAAAPAKRKRPPRES
ncbi:MAG: carboxypeptidase-like regulatory domain-containing protein [Planctomycetia bacterium]|nr:carboxypeptidase-like regulatory domain-containing protein [Planctomycetia bacterium]